MASTSSESNSPSSDSISPSFDSVLLCLKHFWSINEKDLDNDCSNEENGPTNGSLNDKYTITLIKSSMQQKETQLVLVLDKEENSFSRKCFLPRERKFFLLEEFSFLNKKILFSKPHTKLSRGYFPLTIGILD